MPFVKTKQRPILLRADRAAAYAAARREAARPARRPPGSEFSARKLTRARCPTGPSFGRVTVGTARASRATAFGRPGLTPSDGAAAAN